MIKPDDYVLCALLRHYRWHVGLYNRKEIAAAIAHPFVTEDLHWMVNHHAEFQGQYFFDSLAIQMSANGSIRYAYFDLDPRVR